MTTLDAAAPVSHPDRFFIGGEWVAPSSDAMIDVIDSGTEELYFRVAEAQAEDMARAVAAARTAFDDGPWPRLTHAERAEYLRAFGPALQAGLRAATVHGWEWPDFLEFSIGPHREVLEAVMDHDPDRAGDAMDRLVTQSQVSFDYPPGPENAPVRPLTRA